MSLENSITSECFLGICAFLDFPDFLQQKADVTVKLYHVFGHYQLYGVQMSQSLAEALGISIFQILER